VQSADEPSWFKHNEALTKDKAWRPDPRLCVYLDIPSQAQTCTDTSRRIAGRP
jgi:hypothetical protein